MKRIISAGIIIFRRTKDGVKFLLLYHGRNYWNFAKGKLEAEERSWQAALREVREETGLKATELRFVRDFKTREQFMYRSGAEKIVKIVILFLAETRQAKITVSHEHEGFGWFTYPEAKRAISKFKDSVKILDEAHAYIQKSRTPGRQSNSARAHALVPASGTASGTVKGIPGSGQHTE